MNSKSGTKNHTSLLQLSRRNGNSLVLRVRNRHGDLLDTGLLSSQLGGAVELYQS